jgi:hypothetical protein
MCVVQGRDENGAQTGDGARARHFAQDAYRRCFLSSIAWPASTEPDGDPRPALASPAPTIALSNWGRGPEGGSAWTQYPKEARAAIEPLLALGETVLATVPGPSGSAVVATDRRVFVFKRLIGAGSVRHWPLTSVANLLTTPATFGTLNLTVQIVGDTSKSTSTSPNVMAIPGRGYEAVVAALRTAVADGQAKAAGRGDAIQDGPLGNQLSVITHGWTIPAITRTYEGSETGRRLMDAETQVLGVHGYVPASQSQDGGHIHAGRILMTGGLSVLAGSAGTRAKGSITVTFQRAPTVSAPIDIPDQIRKLGDLRDAGILTAAEFEAKKAELLRRM